MTRRNRQYSQAPLFEAPRPAVDTRVYLQLRRRGRAKDVLQCFDTQQECAAFIVGGGVTADEALITQRDTDGSMALFYGGYMADVRQWAQEAAQHGRTVDAIR